MSPSGCTPRRRARSGWRRRSSSRRISWGDGMKVLVAGASGVVGYSAVKHFVGVPGCAVVGLSRRTPLDLDSATLVSVDLNDAYACRTVVAEHRDVTHLVYAALFEKPGLVAGWRARDQMETNLQMFRNLLDPLVAQGGPLE